MARHCRLPLVVACVAAVAEAVADSKNEVTLVGKSTRKNEVTPVAKVVELLDVLSQQLEAGGRADGLAFVEYVSWYMNQSSSAKTIARQTKENIATLQTGLDEQTTFQSAQQIRLESTANELASNEKDLKDATERRVQERATFESAESTLMRGIDQLERSIDVLGKSAPSSDRASGGSTSFAPVAAAKKLRAVFVQGDGASSDISLSPMQRETLDIFLRDSARSVGLRRSQARGRRLAPEFLQVRLQGENEDDEEEGSGDDVEYGALTGGVTATLQSVLNKARGEIDSSRSAENMAKNEFTELETNLGREIENKQKTLSEIKSQLCHSQELASQLSAQLQAAEELLKVTEADLVEVEAQYAKKNAAYKDRAAKRTDEIMAVHEASKLLTSAAAQRLLDPKEPESFLQAVQSSRSKAIRILRSATSPGIALLAIRSLRRSKGRQRADPFGKVKDVVRSLLEKLKAEQAQEAEHKSWCDTEMSKSDKSQQDKQAWVQKLGDRIAAMDAEISQLALDIGTFKADVTAMHAAADAAHKQRLEDKSQAVQSLQQFEDAQELLKTAISVLKKIYSNSAAIKPVTTDTSDQYKTSAGAGTGVISILEVALSDYVDLQHDLELSESEAEKDFKELMTESNIKAAVFEKDLEYKSRDKVNLEGDKMRASGDMKGYKKELAAMETYIETIKEDCVRKADTYKERMTRRDAELQSLKEALDYLSGEGVS